MFFKNENLSASSPFKFSEEDTAYSKKFRYQNEVLLGAVLFAFLILISAQVTTPEGTTLLKRTVYQAISPFVRAADAVVANAKEFVSGYIYMRGVADENLLLKEKLRGVEIERLRWNYILDDYNRLRDLAKFEETLTLGTIPAKVIARDIADPFRMLIINRGKKHGVSENMPILSVEGVVGRVVITSLLTSQAQLLTDPQSAVAGMHLHSGEQVLVCGTGSSHLNVLYFSQETPLKIGDEIVASGFEGIYPRGIPIGTISLIGEEDGERVVFLKPSAPVKKLQYVLIAKEDE